jgi:hypothetical protein
MPSNDTIFNLILTSIGFVCIIISIILLAIGGSKYNKNKSPSENKRYSNMLYAGQILFPVGLAFIGIYIYSGYQYRPRYSWI